MLPSASQEHCPHPPPPGWEKKKPKTGFPPPPPPPPAVEELPRFGRFDIDVARALKEIARVRDAWSFARVRGGTNEVLLIPAEIASVEGLLFTMLAVALLILGVLCKPAVRARHRMS